MSKLSRYLASNASCKTYRIHTLPVGPGRTTWELCYEHFSHVDLFSLRCQHEGRVPIRIPRNALVLVSSVDQVLCNAIVPMFCSKMEAGVALVVVVWVLEKGRVVVHNTLHQGEMVGDNGASKARVHFDPGLA